MIVRCHDTKDKRDDFPHEAFPPGKPLFLCPSLPGAGLLHRARYSDHVLLLRQFFCLLFSKYGIIIKEKRSFAHPNCWSPS